MLEALHFLHSRYIGLLLLSHLAALHITPLHDYFYPLYNYKEVFQYPLKGNRILSSKCIVPRNSLPVQTKKHASTAQNLQIILRMMMVKPMHAILPDLSSRNTGRSGVGKGSRRGLRLFLTLPVCCQLLYKPFFTIGILEDTIHSTHGQERSAEDGLLRPDRL